MNGYFKARLGVFGYTRSRGRLLVWRWSGLGWVFHEGYGEILGDRILSWHEGLDRVDAYRLMSDLHGVKEFDKLWKELQ